MGIAKKRGEAYDYVFEENTTINDDFMMNTFEGLICLGHTNDGIVVYKVVANW